MRHCASPVVRIAMNILARLIQCCPSWKLRCSILLAAIAGYSTMESAPVEQFMNATAGNEDLIVSSTRRIELICEK